MNSFDGRIAFEAVSAEPCKHEAHMRKHSISNM